LISRSCRHRWTNRLQLLDEPTTDPVLQSCRLDLRIFDRWRKPDDKFRLSIETGPIGLRQPYPNSTLGFNWSIGLPEDPMPLIKDFLWRVLNLAVLIWLLVKFAGKPVKEYFAGRREMIQKGVKEAQEAKAAAEKIYREYQEKLAGLDGELKAIEERAQLEAEREKERMLRETEELVVKLQQQARQMADQEVASAKRQLRTEAAQVALEVAEKLVKENVTEADRQRMVEKYLEKVVRA